MAGFGTFLWSVAKYWWASMSCAVFTGLGLYLGITHQSNRWIVGANALLAVCFLMLAAFMVWRDEHNKFLAEVARNQGPSFLVEIEEAVHSAHNSHLLVKCSVTNLSEKMAGIRSASLLDKHSEPPRTIKADEQFNSATIYASEGSKTISGSGNTSGHTVSEQIGLVHIDNFLKTVSTLLPQAKREVGWLDFAGVLTVDAIGAIPQFSITISDTLGGVHGPVDITERVKGAMIL